jgi:hypothetical protein
MRKIITTLNAMVREDTFWVDQCTRSAKHADRVHDKLTALRAGGQAAPSRAPGRNFGQGRRTMSKGTQLPH